MRIQSLAVLGATVAANLFPDQDPVGQEIQIRNVPFRIIGVLAAKGQILLCSTCMDARGLADAEIMPGAKRSVQRGAAPPRTRSRGRGYPRCTWLRPCWSSTTTRRPGT